MSEIILEAKNVTKKFGGLCANEDVSIHLNKGELYSHCQLQGS